MQLLYTAGLGGGRGVLARLGEFGLPLEDPLALLLESSLEAFGLLEQSVSRITPLHLSFVGADRPVT